MIDLNELERLAKVATPVPWEIEDARAFLDDEDFEIRNGWCCIGYGTGEADAAYIVAACNAVPELIAAHRELLQKVQELERQRELLAKELVHRGHILGSVADADLIKPWIEAAEQAAKEAGE